MEKPIYLESLNIHNFRHGKENPRVIGFVDYAPKGYCERPCFKVLYESDGFIDYIAHVELEDENWVII